MSSRITYANFSAALTDWVLTMGSTAPEGVTPDEAAIDFFVAHLSGGGGIPEFCEQQGLHWGVFAAWIRKDPERDKRFRQGMADRGAIRKEFLLDAWWRTAREEPEDKVTHGDVHKAREALAKAEGVFSDAKAGVQLPDGGKITIIHESQ